MPRLSFFDYNILVATGPLWFTKYRDVLPLELFTCLWLVSPQAQGSVSSACPVQWSNNQTSSNTSSASWSSLCCTRGNFRFVQQMKISTQRPNSEILFLSSWWISLLTHIWKFSAQRLYDGAPYYLVKGACYHKLSHMTGCKCCIR